MSDVKYYSQIGQDKFILNILKQKRNGYFLEIGAGDAMGISNTYTLEKYYNWRGLMIEYDIKNLDQYVQLRTNSIHVMRDATTVDYKDLLDSNSIPKNMDYLQIDLDVNNRSTLTTLEILDSTVFDTYKFSVVTFEHDIYTGDHFNTRNTSRQIFNKRGYVSVFKDLCDYTPYIVFEDWYVHPDLVDMSYVNNLIENNQKYYFNHEVTGRAIMSANITYN